MFNSVGNFLVKADNVCDCIPVISTLSNLVDLFEKRVVLPLMSKQDIVSSHYYKHLESKSILRCIILLIPVIGNVVVFIYNVASRKYNNRKRDVVLSAVQLNGLALQYASQELRGDKAFMLEMVQRSCLALEYASQELREKLLPALGN